MKICSWPFQCFSLKIQFILLKEKENSLGMLVINYMVFVLFVGIVRLYLKILFDKRLQKNIKANFTYSVIYKINLFDFLHLKKTRKRTFCLLLIIFVFTSFTRYSFLMVYTIFKIYSDNFIWKIR